MNSFVIFTESEGQILSDQIKKDGKPLDITDCDVGFYMRHATSADLKVNNGTVSIEDEVTGKVSYAWDEIDLDDPGEYFGWWKVTTPSLTDIDTDEFFIIVTKHSPGKRTETGAIYRKALSKIPITWQALENLDTYGDSLLQETIEVCKLNIFGTSVLVEDEVTYDIRIQDYIAKCAVLSIIPAGIDYWNDQYETVSTQGGPGVEIASYQNRLEALKKIQEDLLIDISKTKPLIEELIGYQQLAPLTSVPEVSDGGDCAEGFVTPNPTKHFRDYAFDGRRAERYRGTIW